MGWREDRFRRQFGREPPKPAKPLPQSVLKADEDEDDRELRLIQAQTEKLKKKKKIIEAKLELKRLTEEVAEGERELNGGGVSEENGEEEEAESSSTIHVTRLKEVKLGKARQYFYKVNQYGLTGHGHFEAIAEQVLRIVKQHQDLNHRQVRLRFISSQNESHQAPVSFHGNSLTLADIQDELEGALAHRFATDSAGSWLLVGIDVSGKVAS